MSTCISVVHFEYLTVFVNHTSINLEERRDLLSPQLPSIKYDIVYYVVVAVHDTPRSHPPYSQKFEPQHHRPFSSATSQPPATTTLSFSFFEFRSSLSEQDS